MDKKRLQELAGITESEVDLRNRIHKQIGDHVVVVNDFYRDRNFGSNPMADIEVDGKRYQAYKQGMINIWAFPGRTSLSREEQREFDQFLDQTREEMIAADQAEMAAS